MEKIKMTEWQKVKLGDICEIKGGKRLPKGVSLITVKNNHPYIRVRDLGHNRILQLNDEYEYVDDETQKTISHYIVSKNDVLISIVGTIGLIGIVGDSLDGANLTENCVKLINLKNVDRNYLYYFLMSKEGQNEIQQGTVGAVQSKLPIKNIQAIAIFLPPLEIQRKIAGILGALDDKIEVLRAQNKTLEQMAQAVFQSWFVDFDIVRAKAAGLPAADVCKKYHITPDICALFPSSFTSDPLPQGWKKKSLGDFLLLSYGKALKESDRIYGSVPVYGSSGQIGMHNESLVKAPGIVVGRKGTVGSVIWCDYDFYPIDTVFYVQFLKEAVYWHFTYFLLKNLKLQNLSGDSAVPGLNRDAAYAQTFVCPRTEFLHSFEKVADILFCKIKSNTEQIRTLEQTRDTLLPQLLSGKLIF